MTDILQTRIDGPIAVLTMNRPDKRNAMNDALLAALDAFFSAPPEGVKVVVLTGTEGHYCSGLDLSEQAQRDAEGTMRHSRGWHAVMDKIQYSGLPVVSAMFGAVIGGGLELATATHVRIAEPSTIFQLPEGRRGIYVGGGASVRVGRILGADRMIEMMLTGRKYNAEQGERLGLCHYAVDEGEALGLAMDLAGKIAQNASLSNYVMIHALSRIEDMSKADGLFTESLCAALTQTSPDAQEGLRAFLEKRQPRFR
ncbi:crotonase/enoyl-CoA hydratase family protein [Lutimaribacter sp. EGI FJ00015]|uniref:Crotonase/enoyl-CoA hydratase family protein n=1 Tax=Lutimaribacter degradans TaxID=2945989 RepID=A0ACC6A096_9RHOB|nr:crotonase/enoyl-CoA hydratase family protein [Lutimaribacter sp. EGI FJ00013]MCM2563039.1 crotonase/enoyl-CoA hydratase family protein [Lutimaribacter sp. EGI FJ00013]MCO0614218.1 crotonase/enoyl-CoA hydratase family protein [Lutimaribacter sp. EGI FJ00015]MCO0637028.1 crotonase/enoyl-CoA hydratase family protein [Lutimaribacter sp. EGI FJ00014]